MAASRFGKTRLATEVAARLGDESGAAPAAVTDPAAVPDAVAAVLGRFFYDSGSLSVMHTPLAVLTEYFDRLGHHEPAATISGIAANPFAHTAGVDINKTITHLREVLGDARYELLARAGENMSSAAMATDALDQIDQARAELNAVSK
jgi:hypothetical protein